MSSSWNVWDYLQAKENLVGKLDKFPLFYEIPDPYIGKILKDKIKLENVYQVKFPFEITADWIEDQCDNLSLFGQNDIVLVPSLYL